VGSLLDIRQKASYAVKRNPRGVNNDNHRDLEGMYTLIAAAHIPSEVLVNETSGGSVTIVKRRISGRLIDNSCISTGGRKK